MTNPNTASAGKPTDNAPKVHVEHDEAGTTVDHDEHDNAYSG
ncbi:phenylacetate-CoA oxygenase subunit PaaI, partial [Burkholderia multivorans]